jgi:alkylation response protein AidB-like acyl-CoA dehydrogenase
MRPLLYRLSYPARGKRRETINVGPPRCKGQKTDAGPCAAPPAGPIIGPMDLGLDPEEQLIQATFRRFADRSLAAWAAEADRAGEPPAALLAAAGELGLLVDAVPADAGGLLEDGFGHLARVLRGVELGRGCAGLSALVEANVEPALAVGRWGSPAARAALFGGLVAGELALFHHDVAGAVAARGDGDGLVLDGVLGPLPVLGRAGHLVLGLAGAEPALVLLAIGDHVEPVAAPSAWRAAGWGRLALDAERVVVEQILARGDAARVAIREVATWQRLGLAARALGVAAAAIEHATRYGEERVQFGQPIGRFESIARLRDENTTAIAAARWLLLHAAWQVDRGAAEAADSASRARALAAAVVGRATIDAVQIFGGYGFVNDFPVEKLMRDARPFEVLGGNDGLWRVVGE